jgi:hypothetical protein
MKHLLWLLLWNILFLKGANSQYMKESLLQKIDCVTDEATLSRQKVEQCLGLRLTLDKKMSEQQGMQIYELAADNILPAFSKVELRIFGPEPSFLLLLYPDPPVGIALQQMKEIFSFESFVAGNKRRNELPGHLFSRNGFKVGFYYDTPLKNVGLVTVRGTLSP